MATICQLIARCQSRLTCLTPSLPGLTFVSCLSFRLGPARTSLVWSGLAWLGLAWLGFAGLGSADSALLSSVKPIQPGYGAGRAGMGRSFTLPQMHNSAGGGAVEALRGGQWAPLFVKGSPPALVAPLWGNRALPGDCISAPDYGIHGEEFVWVS